MILSVVGLVIFSIFTRLKVYRLQKDLQRMEDFLYERLGEVP